MVAEFTRPGAHDGRSGALPATYGTGKVHRRVVHKRPVRPDSQGERP